MIVEAGVAMPRDRSSMEEDRQVVLSLRGSRITIRDGGH